MMRTTSATPISIAMLTSMLLCGVSLLNSTEAKACGNSMQHRVQERSASTAMAMEYFEDRAYLQAIDTALDAHSAIKLDPEIYKTSKSRKLIRASKIIAISMIRIHGQDHEDVSLLDDSLGSSPAARIAWASSALAWHLEKDAESPTNIAYHAEAQARSTDVDTLKQALASLQSLARQDLMPDAHSWATLATLERVAGFDDSSSVASCKAVNPFVACDRLLIDLSQTPEFASRTVRDKRRVVIRSRSRKKSKKGEALDW